MARLVEQVAATRADAAAARVLAGAADRDVAAFGAKLDAHTQVLTALRETQLEHGEKLREHDERFDRLERRFDGLERDVREGFATLGTGMAQITALLTGIAGSDRE